ncbi:MAG: pentapeptide repeat-containing protein [Candidatus Acidiferrales bacterium]
MDFLFRLALRGRKKAADDVPQAQEGAQTSPVAPAGVLTSAEDLPSAAATLAEIFPDEIPSEETFDMGSPEEAGAQANSADVPATPTTRDWALEEKLASHREWVESQGAAGKAADFAGAELEGAELIGVNLRFADLHDANLKGADMLLADLRDTCLARANFEEACLVGTSLEGANLESASLASAMGLLPRQIAGTNLHQASLPKQLLGFEALSEFERASKTASRLLTAITLMCVLCCLMVWKTKDVQLVANLAVIPFLHSPQAAATLPTVQFFSLLPVLLMILYLVFQFHLQRLWDATLELPAVFPDGRKLGSAHGDGAGRRGPRVVLGLLRAHFRWMNWDAPSTRAIEKALSLLAAYWTVPATLVLFWARTLTLGDIHSTILHALLVATSTGVALYATTRVGRPEEAWKQRESLMAPLLKELKRTKPAAFAIGLGALLALLSMGTIVGAPHDPRRAPQYGAADIRRWAPKILWAVGYDPFADLTEAAISTKPANWTGDDQEISSVRGARMNGANLRYAQAYGVFLANAHLWRADFEGAFMPEADLRGADLGESNMRSAELDGARMFRANLDRAQLDSANLSRADLREANMSYDSLANAILTDARLDGATLYGARLSSATLIRASLEKADLRDSHMEGANLDRADLEQAYLWSANLSGAQLENARLGSALLIEADLGGADLEGVQFPASVLTGATLNGANLDGADLRGAFGLTPNQVCSARSRIGALLDDALQTQVNAQCGGAAPLPPAAAAHP